MTGYQWIGLAMLATPFIILFGYMIHEDARAAFLTIIIIIAGASFIGVGAALLKGVLP